MDDEQHILRIITQRNTGKLYGQLCNTGKGYKGT